MNWIIDLLTDPRLKKIDFDGEERFEVHRKILAQKGMLRSVFSDFHHTFDCLDKRFLSNEGVRLEIGAGVAPMRDAYPDVIATDITYSQGIDMALNAEAMNMPNESVRVVFGQNCFHHISNPCLFFDELQRVLVPGGGAILIEPYYGPLAAFLFPRLFRGEGYDKDFSSWKTPSAGPMNGANQALSYIVFKRDLDEFHRSFPKLAVTHEETCHNYLTYLVSGGLNFRQLVPNWTAPILRSAQILLSSLDRWLALHHVIVIKKQE